MAPQKRVEVVLDAQEVIAEYRAILAREFPHVPYPGDPTVEDVLAFKNHFSLPPQAEAA